MSLKKFAASISKFKKERYIKQMSEDDFRDRVIRPLFLQRGLQDGRDLCGPQEAGKDAIFINENCLGIQEIYVLQTKKGNLNLSKNRSQNAVTAATQLKTALQSRITLISTKQKVLPICAILCASGRINDKARNFIIDEVQDPHIVFMDIDDLIPQIDTYIPELWCDIDTNLFPYLRALKRSIEKDTQLFTRGELVASDLPPVPTSDKLFISLNVYRYILKLKRDHGRVEQVPDIEELPVTGLLTRRESLILLIGGAGSGKSTAFLRMAYILCERAETTEDLTPIPIFFRAQEIVNQNDKTLLDMSIAKGQEISGRLESPINTTHLTRGLLYVFIDALDEVPNMDMQQLVVKKAIDFQNRYSNCRVFISSRDYSYIEQIPELNTFVQFHLSPISFKQAEKILKRLLKTESLPMTEAEEFLRRMQDVHGLELNPLIVTIFAASSEHSRRDIPANITELFKKFTEQMLGRWDSSKGLALQYQAPLKDFVLTQITYKLHSKKKTRIQVVTLKKIIEEELVSRGHKANIEILTDEIVNRSGLFRKIGDEIEFRHFMLQEFFAGRGIPSPENVHQLVVDNWWRRSLVFYFGEKPNEGELLQKLICKLDSVSEPDAYQGTITLGLAIQASYLLVITEKIPIVEWVIVKMAKIFHDFEKEVVSKSNFPLHDFLKYYLFARDAVAFSLLKENHEKILGEIMTENDSKVLADMKQFWFIIGLIESGYLREAEDYLKDFNPTDRRLFLGIHLGSFLVQHLRLTTKEERDAAKCICDSISGHLIALKKQLIDEFKTELFEVQKEEIKALPQPKT
jgi:hypothetical protein